MFELNPAPTFEAPVALSVPGVPEPLNIKVVFKHKGRTALKDWLARTPGSLDAVILHEVIDSWSGVVIKGQQVPYDLTALTTLLENYGAAHNEILRAYLYELTEAKRKN